MKITINDEFKVQKKFDISGEDLFSLNNLYLPLIGVDSFALYNYVFSLSSKEVYSFKKILDSLHLLNLSHLDNCFEKLEGIGLISRFYNEQKGYMFEMKKPLSVASFMANPLLVSFLTSQIGEVEVKNIKQIVNKTVKGYQDISKTFTDVYKIESAKPISVYASIFNSKIQDNVIIKNPDFDYTFFKLSFDTMAIDEKVFDDKQFEKTIINISFTYNLNEEEMKSVVLNTIALDKDLKLSDISKNARLLYQEKNKGATVSFVTKEPDPFMPSVDDEETLKLIRLVDSITPENLLESLSGIKPSISELKIFEDLLNNTHFPIGVINLMILMVNEEKNGQLPGYNYFEKIANEWARANIKTSKDAVEYMNKVKKEREERKEKPKIARDKTKSRNVKPEPKWQDEYEKNKQSKTEDNTLTKEEKEEILKKSKNIFK